MSASALPRRLSSRILQTVAALVLVTGLGAAAASVAPTQSAWTDPTSATAAVSAGEWSAPQSYGCVAMNANGTVKQGGTCTVTSLVFDQYGSDALHYRNYYVGVESNAGTGYVQLTLDLSAASVRWNTGTGTWKWGNAATTGGEFSPTSSCASLPTMTANTPTMWISSRSFYFQVVDNRSAVWSGSVTCS
ncbi:MAG: hypothetical protein ABW024_07715 [Microbacterium sp.]